LAPVIGGTGDVLDFVGALAFIVARTIKWVFGGEGINPGFGDSVELAADGEGVFEGCCLGVCAVISSGDCLDCGGIGLQDAHVVVWLVLGMI
jgi:hypothetical protein